jgi:serpin B
MRALFIANILHKAFMNVGEKGTEAAAATGVVYGADAGISTKPAPELPVNANHPFLIFLRDEPTGAILFMGRVLEPIQN